ncbi:MAG: YdeI/OmpD-associated family protein, partial [Parvularculaceae bacterium]|nr:YdeI/OmpD-associated family protein [Parvularculaceae bacterium]
INKARIAALVAEGRMTPAGLARIEAAKADGSWSKLDGVETLEEPADLLAAFRRHAGSRAFWAAFPPSTRRGVLEWIGNAKGADTRARRVEEAARLAAENIRANTPRQPKRR